MARKVIMNLIWSARLISSTGNGLRVSFLAVWMSIDMISGSHRPFGPLWILQEFCPSPIRPWYGKLLNSAKPPQQAGCLDHLTIQS
jgi:hypothetical protein